MEKVDEWKTIEPGVWKPKKESDQITGVLVSKEPKDEITGLSVRYYLETKAGMFFVWGTAVLDDRMKYVKIGQKVRITFEGKTTNKRSQTVNLFKVEVAEKPVPKDAKNIAVQDGPLDIGQIEELK